MIVRATARRPRLGEDIPTPSSTLPLSTQLSLWWNYGSRGTGQIGPNCLYSPQDFSTDAMAWLCPTATNFSPSVSTLPTLSQIGHNVVTSVTDPGGTVENILTAAIGPDTGSAGNTTPDAVNLSLSSKLMITAVASVVLIALLKR